jgi:pimeloyl-ACP methyl ester carboxylesterase
MLRYLDTHGQRLAALPMGERRAGEPLILLHGVTHSVYFWAPDPFYGELGPCWSLSLPGHFPASAPADLRQPLTTEQVIEPLAAAIGQLYDRPATLIGISTGGFAALALAARYPQLVRRVISISGFARGRWIGSFGMLQAAARGGPLGEAIFRGTAGMAGRSELALRMIMATAGPGWSYGPIARYPYLDAVLRAMLPALAGLDADAMLAYFAAMPAIDIGPLLPTIAAPTLLIAGGRDPIVPTDESRRAAAAIPNATLKIFPHAGHLPNFEHYPEFRQLVSAWLR